MKFVAHMAIRTEVPFTFDTKHDKPENEADAEKHSKERRAAAKFAEKDLVAELKKHVPGKVVSVVVEEVTE